MKQKDFLQGFSKLSSLEKLKAMAPFFKKEAQAIDELMSYHHPDEDTQSLLEEFSENTITNFPMPFNIAPNFLIDGTTYHLPMVTEESSVIAAASKAAKFWFDKGGFKTAIKGMEKIGQVHFTFKGNTEALKNNFNELKTKLFEGTEELTENMRKRGGGILNIELRDLTDKEADLFQLHATFNTLDAMGANFVNSCLEEFADIFKVWFNTSGYFNNDDDLDIIMCILSNYTPNCMVSCWVECEISDFDDLIPGISGKDFTQKFAKAVRIAQIDPYRATTHNKGIYNGIDAVVLASGNDFRAVEACGHAYASASGQYTSLTRVELTETHFKFILDLPLALGVVGGLTNLHPLVKRALELMGHPDAASLMKIAAAAGLANNFAAIKSLTTTGIQQGHMKMHLLNILNQFHADESEKKMVVDYFKDKKVSVSEARIALENIRMKQDNATLAI